MTTDLEKSFKAKLRAIAYKIKLTSYLKGDLFEDSVELTCYPKEFIFAQ